MFSFVLISLLTFLNDYSVKTIPTRALPRSEVKQIKLVHFCCILLVFAQKHKDLLLGIGKGLFDWVGLGPQSVEAQRAIAWVLT